jgi:heme a synthase
MANILPTLKQNLANHRFAGRILRSRDTGPGATPPPPPHGSDSIRLWLLVAAALVLLTLSIGGMTRLTNSGLSITEWEPIMGIIPPLSAADWQEQFDKYKTTYEYRFVNKDMTLDEFRYIYNWEWRHRLLARLVFLSVFLPFIFFLLAGRLSKAMQTKIFVILGLIVLQGFVGWFMVQSGLRNEVRVSPYRLALHLGLASLLFAMLVAMALSQDKRELPAAQDLPQSRLWGRILIGLLFALILFGALVAGLRGGKTHDTWPLMEGQLIPGNLLAMSPWIVNFFENPLTAQWLHRLLAYGLVAAAVVHWRATIRRDEPDEVQTSARWLVIGIVGQVLLGIVTVLNQVPVPLGLAHQLWAFLLLALAIWHLYEIERHIAGTQSVTTWSETTIEGQTAPGSQPRSPVPAPYAPSPGMAPGTIAPGAPRSPSTLPTPPAPPVGGMARPAPSTGPQSRPAGPTVSASFPSIGTSPVNPERPAGPVVPVPYRRPLDS